MQKVMISTLGSYWIEENWLVRSIMEIQKTERQSEKTAGLYDQLYFLLLSRVDKTRDSIQRFQRKESGDELCYNEPLNKDIIAATCYYRLLELSAFYYFVRWEVIKLWCKLSSRKVSFLNVIILNWRFNFFWFKYFFCWIIYLIWNEIFKRYCARMTL